MEPQPEIVYDLYLAAYLNDHKKNILIPDYWCDSLDLARSINSGLKKNENHLIFFSPDLNKIPDFSLPIRHGALDLTRDGCYFGKILRAFNSKADAVQYLKKSRSILPAVYNSQRSGGRTTEETMLLTANEYNNALGSGFTSMNQRFVVKTEKFCEEISNLRNRIVEFNMGGIDGLDDSDIEFLQDEVDDDELDSDLEFEILFPPSVCKPCTQNCFFFFEFY